MSDQTTPMMGQYRRIKGEVSADTILFFRLGDFYEMFFEDAKEASQILDITLTKRQGVPMCGVPFHAAESYLAKLIRAGRKVAICDQVEDPSVARGIVRREITRVVTPGTVLEDHVLDSGRNNYLAGLFLAGDVFGLAMLDVSTGAFWIEESRDPTQVADNLARYAPAECIVPEEHEEDPALRALLQGAGSSLLTAYEGWTFEYDTAEDLLKRHFSVHSLSGFGCDGHRAGVGAAGAILHYVSHELRRQVAHVRQLSVRHPADYMLLDDATISNLDLVASRGTSRTGSPTTLLGVLDATKTAMGSRLLRDWMVRPLMKLDEINHRHDAVQALGEDRRLLGDLRDRLLQVKDLERLIARLGAGTGNARDLRALDLSLAELPGLKEQFASHPVATLSSLVTKIEPLPDLVALIDRAIVDEPPIAVKDGGMIRKGYHAELDELKAAATEGRQWLADFQAREQERTGIKSLKVRHNKVFGYYIEITKANLADAPADYIRKQTLVNAERFITPELKEYENKILGAQERSLQLELELFQEVRTAAVAETARIQQSAAAIAALDALGALADRALALSYVRPRMTDAGLIRIRDGRHPVIEQMTDAERFVPNDTILDNLDCQVVIITGPNMAGKSTYIRQVALIVIMAQMGSFVPAAEAEIGVVDRVFTRVGASDDLARGRSTFMVEMQETANILNNATSKSLIVLDEIGRGTSTFDGISIAWAVAEYLHNQPRVKAKTLFATHYHELTDLALALPGVKNYNVLVREKNDKIAFLRKIVPGAADKSYGIQVARLAGLPAEVIDRAKEILGNLEEGEFEGGQPKIAKHEPKKRKEDPGQLNLFGEPPPST
ncbi:MAG TPA: DNA mismatch repair protein MutS [Kiritimatiellia bacterium]|nr:DNA mismatch repair protein MutS [Kiritimatiellia bacterium]